MSGGGYNPNYTGKGGASAPPEAYVVTATPVVPPRAGSQPEVPVASFAQGAGVARSGAPKDQVDPEWLRAQQGESAAEELRKTKIKVLLLLCFGLAPAC